jgi:hypothetical protein
MGRKTLIGFMALVMVLAACSSTESGGDTTAGPSDGGGGGLGDGAGVGLPAVALQQFDECDALLGWIQTEAAERVGPYGFGDGGFPVPFLAEEGLRPAAETAVDFAADDGAGDSSAEGGGFSTTNNQEVGVDEPDAVKTDGEFLYVLSDDRLVVVRADADDPTVVDSTSFTDAYPSEMILGEDRLYVIASKWMTDIVALERIGVPAYEQDLFVIHEVLVGDDGTLEGGSTLEISGGYVTGRLVDGAARIVVRHDPGRSLPFLYPSSEAAEEQAAEFNRSVIEESSIEDWLPWYVLTTASGDETSGMLTSCDRVTAPQEFSGMSTISVLTMDMSDDLDTGNAMSLFGAADTIYSSTTSLYAATYDFPAIPFWRFEDDEIAEDPDPEFSTAIHQFDITDGDGAEYVASGAVPGHLLNQFAMSEHDGHLRVATTEGSPWWCCDEEPSSSGVTILRADGDELVAAGAVGDLGIDEQIFGVRFVGDVGYVVTFRQTDPLYVIDLSDPAAPSVEGELKITGYSAYLHPVSDRYVVGVGQEATLEGTTVGTKVSLFDVGDPSNPLEVDRWVLERSSSQVEWDHKAFLWWEPESAAVVPVQSWQGGQFGAVALDVGDGTLSERGRITQGRPSESGPRPGCDIVERDDVDIDEGSELFWIFEEGALVVLCDDEAARGVPGYSCEPLENIGYPEDETDALRGDAATVDLCWPEGDRNREIRRSVVIGDVLWTVGWSTVQANDFASLDPIGRVDI